MLLIVLQGQAVVLPSIIDSDRLLQHTQHNTTDDITVPRWPGALHR